MSLKPLVEFNLNFYLIFASLIGQAQDLPYDFDGC